MLGSASTTSTALSAPTASGACAGRCPSGGWPGRGADGEPGSRRGPLHAAFIPGAVGGVLSACVSLLLAWQTRQAEATVAGVGNGRQRFAHLSCSTGLGLPGLIGGSLARRLEQGARPQTPLFRMHGAQARQGQGEDGAQGKAEKRAGIHDGTDRAVVVVDAAMFRAQGCAGIFAPCRPVASGDTVFHCMSPRTAHPWREQTLHLSS